MLPSFESATGKYAENVEEYLNALKWALEQKKITNIALAGPYGSGKSSIIDTFLEKHKDESLFQTDTLENNSWIINKIKSCILQHDKVCRFNEISKKISMATFIEANSNGQCKNEAHENEDEAAKGEDKVAKKICISADEVMEQKIKTIIVTHKDRFIRFGYDWFEKFCTKFNTTIVVVNNEELSPQEELVQDIVSILHVFSCRLYGLRKYKKQIERNVEIAKELQDGNKSVRGTESQDS